MVHTHTTETNKDNDKQRRTNYDRLTLRAHFQTYIHDILACITKKPLRHQCIHPHAACQNWLIQSSSSRPHDVHVYIGQRPDLRHQSVYKFIICWPSNVASILPSSCLPWVILLLVWHWKRASNLGSFFNTQKGPKRKKRSPQKKK